MLLFRVEEAAEVTPLELADFVDELEKLIVTVELVLVLLVTDEDFVVELEEDFTEEELDDVVPR